MFNGTTDESIQSQNRISNLWNLAIIRQKSVIWWSFSGAGKRRTPPNALVTVEKLSKITKLHKFPKFPTQSSPQDNNSSPLNSNYSAPASPRRNSPTGSSSEFSLEEIIRNGFSQIRQSIVKLQMEQADMKQKLENLVRIVGPGV